MSLKDAALASEVPLATAEKYLQRHVPEGTKDFLRNCGLLYYLLRIRFLRSEFENADPERLKEIVCEKFEMEVNGLLEVWTEEVQLEEGELVALDPPPAANPSAAEKVQILHKKLCALKREIASIEALFPEEK